MSRVRSAVRRLRELYGLLGPLKSGLWVSLALLVAQAAWSGVVLAALGAFLQSLGQAGLVARTPVAGQPVLDRLAPLFAAIPDGQRPAWAFVLAGVCLALGSLVETLVQAYITRFSTEFICSLRERVYARLLAAGQPFHDGRQKGTLLQMLINEVRSCYTFFKTLLNVAVDGFQFAVYAGFAAFLSWRLSLVVLVSGAAVLAVNRLFARTIKGVARRSLSARERLMVVSEESLGGVKQVKLLNLEARSSAEFSVHNREAERTNRTIALLMAWQDTASTLLGLLALAALVAAALRFRLLELSAVLLFLYVINQAMGCLKGLASRYSLFSSGLPSVDSVTRFLAESEPLVETSGALTRARLLERELRFEGVGLDYGERKDALRGVDLTVPRGKTVAFVGPSGAGKTSLVNLVARLYDCTRGRVTADGTPLQEFELAWLRGRVGLVNQEPLLFNATVRENLLMARPGATDAELRAAAVEANADEFISELPQGYDTAIGDRGVRLSGGQKQRLHIAQIFLKDPEVLLLDEATSALDSKSEELVQAALQRLSKDRTTLVVAHRLSTVRSADVIVVVDGGGIVETGSWSDLMAREGAFYDMVQRQALSLTAERA